MPTLWGASGGKLVVVGGATGVPHEMATGEWTLNRSNTLSEATHSGTSKNELWVFVKRGGEVRYTIQWDSTKTPETAGLLADEDGITVDMFIGDSGMKYAAVPWLVQSCELKGCDQNGHVQYTGTAKINGALPAPS
jgi:hypothetical protein